MPFMDWFTELRSRVRRIFSSRGRFDREMEEEMRLHRDLRARELHEDGADVEDALYAARLRFGNTLRLREEMHQAWGWTWLDNLALDLRYAFRRLRKSPGFAAVAVLTLALGIGANTAIFTLIQQILLQPLPVPRPNELYSLGDDKNGCCGGGLLDDFSVYSYPLYQYLRDHTPEFSELAAFSSGDTALSVRRQGDTNPARPFRGEFVSANYFTVFGVGAAAGRMLEAQDDQRNTPPVAVMSYRAWHEKFAASPELVGETLVIKGLPVTLIGVAAPGFYGDTLRSDPPDIWMPLAVEAAMNPQFSLFNQWNEYWLYAIGRLRPDAQPAQVQAHVTAGLQQWLTENYVADRYNSDPYIAGRYTKLIPRQHIVVIPAAGGVASTRDNTRQPLELLMAVSALVLLIACANIANLLLARGAAARAQTAVRVALGASRGRILRQTLTEGALPAILGGAGGLWVAMVTTRGILPLVFVGAEYIPLQATPSLPVLGFAFFISLLTGLICSAAPAWIASRTQPDEPMRAAARSTRDHATRPQKILLVLQACISLVLLVGAGLLTLSLRRLETQSFGIDTRGRLMAWISLSRNQYPAGRLPALYQQFEQQLSRIPGVVSVSFSNGAPVISGGMSEPISIEGMPPVPLLPDIRWPGENRVSAHYFETVGTRVLRGRSFDQHDTAASPHVAVVDETFARFFFPGENPVGKRFGIQTVQHSHDYEIVGIVQDAQFRTAQRGTYPTFFLPLLQEEKYEDTAEDVEQFDSHYAYNIQLRVAGRPDDFQEPLRRALAHIDPNLTVTRILSFDDQFSRNFGQERLIARLTTLYGLLALALASVGLYGVASYAAARRTREIGIRMALGADRNNVVTLMLRGALRPIVLGLAIGFPAALAGARLISSRLYDVKGFDPMVFASAMTALVSCALAASYLPARRAASIEPVIALRHE
jgi:predicted permease